MYFLLAAAAARFHLLSYGLALVLVFIGSKMLLIDVVKIPVALSLAWWWRSSRWTMLWSVHTGAEGRRLACAVMPSCDKTATAEGKKRVLRGKTALRSVFHAVLFAPQGAC